MIALLPALRLWRMLSQPVESPGHRQESFLEKGSRSRELDDEPAEIGFRRFVAARWGALQRYAFLLTGDHQLAEDVVQAALEKCWRRWGEDPERLAGELRAGRDREHRGVPSP